jgi:hypothetical protein
VLIPKTSNSKKTKKTLCLLIHKHEIGMDIIFEEKVSGATKDRE